MPTGKENAEQALEDVGHAIATAFAQLAGDVLAGKKRIVVVSSPEWFVRPSRGEDPASTATQLVGFRHTIEVEDLTPPA